MIVSYAVLYSLSRLLHELAASALWLGEESALSKQKRVTALMRCHFFWLDCTVSRCIGFFSQPDSRLEKKETRQFWLIFLTQRRTLSW